MDLAAWNPGRQRELGDIAPHELGPLGVAECLAQDVAVVCHRPRREAGRHLGEQVGLHLRWAQVRDGDGAQRRRQMDLHDAAVGDVGLGPHRQAREREPGLEEFANPKGRGFLVQPHGRSADVAKARWLSDAGHGLVQMICTAASCLRVEQHIHHSRAPGRQGCLEGLRRTDLPRTSPSSGRGRPTCVA